MQSEVNVFPVPHAMIIFPLSAPLKPSWTPRHGHLVTVLEATSFIRPGQLSMNPLVQRFPVKGSAC